MVSARPARKSRRALIFTCIVVAWLVSVIIVFDWRSEALHKRIVIGAGHIVVRSFAGYLPHHDRPFRFVGFTPEYAFNGWFDASYEDSTEWRFECPTWLIATTALAVLLICRRTRAQQAVLSEVRGIEKCVHCGYELLPTQDRCPECGRTVVTVRSDREPR